MRPLKIEALFAFDEMNDFPINIGKKTANFRAGFSRTRVSAGRKLGAIFLPRKSGHASLSLLLGLALTHWTSAFAQETSVDAGEQATVALAQPLAQPADAGIGTIPFSLFGDCDNNRFVFGQACLSVAAAFFGTETLEWLLDKGIGVNDVDEIGRVALHWAAMFNDSKVVNFLVEKGSDVDARDRSESTPLHLASFTGNNEAVFALIEQGADIEARDNREWTPLHLAADYDNPDTVAALVEKGADIEARTDYDDTPLHVAAQEFSNGALKALIDKGAIVDAYSNAGISSTPLRHAAGNNNIEAIEVLLDHGADINVETKGGSRALNWAAARNARDAVELLVDSGADTDQMVFPAVSNGSKDSLQVLIEKGVVGEAEANSRLEDVGYMPLHLAALSSVGDPDATVQMLIDLGADTEARIVEEYPALYLYPTYGRDQINGWINSIPGFDPKGQHLIDGYGFPTTYGFTPLHYAAANQNGKPLRILIDNGVDVNAAAKFSGTPLHIATVFGKLDNVRALLKAGASLSATDSFGNQPIHLAARKKGAEVMRVLLEANADVEARAANGYTALQYAARRGDPAVFATLLEAGARTDVVTEDGQTIMELAEGNKKLSGSSVLEGIAN